MKIILIIFITVFSCFGYEILINTTEDSEFKTNDRNIRDNGNEVVLDRVSKLLWQDNSEAVSVKKNYKDANKYCENLKLAGYDDWSLPKIFELESIADYSKEEPAIKSGFKNVSSSFYWSSSSCIETSQYAINGKARELSYKDRQYSTDTQGRNAWSVSFTNGASNNQIRKTSKRNVRCVRTSTD